MKAKTKPSQRGISILLTNDDGINAPGIAALERALRSPRGRAAGVRRVLTVAPAFQCTAMSRSISILKPLLTARLGADRYQVEGTPTDCVILGLRHLRRHRIDLVISGINHGANMGDDISYSGTVSAALEAARMGVPALAVSLFARTLAADFRHTVTVVLRAVRRMTAFPPPRGVALSINVPEGRPRGVRVTRPGKRVYGERILERVDPFGRSYYWLAAGPAHRVADEPGTDVTAVSRGYVSVTPLDSDLHARYTDMSGWETI